MLSPGNALQIAIELCFAVGVPILLFGFVSFDQLIKIEHDSYRKCWERDGKPIGFLWRPAGAGWVFNGIATQILFFRWLFIRPPWSKSSAYATTWLRRFRMCALAWNVIAIMLAAFLFFGPR